MTEPVLVTLILCGTSIILVPLLFIFGGTDSTADKWIKARASIKCVEAEHALKCPRLTDTRRS